VKAAQFQFWHHPGSAAVATARSPQPYQVMRILHRDRHLPRGFRRLIFEILRAHLPLNFGRSREATGRKAMKEVACVAQPNTIVRNGEPAIGSKTAIK